MPEIGLEERLNEILTNPELRKKLGDKEVKRFLELYKRNKKIELNQNAKEDFMSFVKSVWPGFVEGRHHKI